MRKLYRAGDHEYGPRGPVYVRTGETRPPQRGEYYLSGAVPEVYPALADLSASYLIMRPATEAESVCPCCRRPLPTEA